MANKKRRITVEEARELVRDKLDIDNLGTLGLRKMEKIIPFSWHVYCKDNNLNPNLLMDSHEKRIRRDEKRCAVVSGDEQC